jgi:hypothetical protein
VKYKLRTVNAEETGRILLLHPNSESADRFGHIWQVKEGELCNWKFSFKGFYERKKKSIYFKAKTTLGICNIKIKS